MKFLLLMLLIALELLFKFLNYFFMVRVMFIFDLMYFVLLFNLNLFNFKVFLKGFTLFIEDFHPK